ncbi:MAG TPA: arginine--tRNA ligase [Chloroflexota bacterium]|nr:arginine--tRNA ligase [Chloroflexota bacterium]
MIRDEIASLLRSAAEAAQTKGLLPQVALPEVTVEPPQRAEHGDYATNLAMRLARAARMAPAQIANVLIQSLPENDAVAEASVAGAGFINFALKPEYLAAQATRIVEEGERFGHNDQGGGRSVQVEFVSANPTERLHAGSGRAAALGDSLANILAAAGWKVEREYYVNDAGSRLEALGQTVLARYLQALGHPAEIPKDGYHGEFLAEYGRELATTHGNRFLELDSLNSPSGPRARPEATDELIRMAVGKIIALHKADTDALGVTYDSWYRAQGLHDRGEVDAVVEQLRASGYVVEREGAVWFSSTALGDDKDNVLIRSNGIPGYLAEDIAYHRDKFVKRGFDRVIDIWGADHQGHVSRMKAAVQAIGIDPERLTIMIHQLVTLKRGDQLVKLSKRAGNIVALADVIEEVGKDACRYFFVSRSPDSHQEFDLELAAKQSTDNPVFYVQYAHARASSILRRAAEAGVQPTAITLNEAAEVKLAKTMLRYPEVLADAAAQLEAHPLAFYAYELAQVVHKEAWPTIRVAGAEAGVAGSRLALWMAARQVLANALGLIGVSAPEVMRSDEELGEAGSAV